LGLTVQSLIIIHISVVFISPLFVSDDLLDPNYLLVKLYNEPEQKKKVVAFGRQLLNKDIKVLSKNIEEIKEEMREIISSNSFSSDETNDKIKKGKNYADFSSIHIKQQFW
jgi:hypothetical protein